MPNFKRVGAESQNPESRFATLHSRARDARAVENTEVINVCELSHHIPRSDQPHWPNGSWAVYRITGDEIVDRTVHERVNPNGYYEGNVIARYSWPGYLRMSETLDGACEMIEKNKTKEEAREAKQKRKAI